MMTIIRKLLTPMTQRIKQAQEQAGKPSEQPLLIGSKNRGYITGYAPYPAEASQKIRGGGCLLIIIMLSSMIGWMTINLIHEQYQLLRHGEETTAIVDERSIEKHPNGRHHVFVYSYQVEGESYTTTKEVSSALYRDTSIGDTIPIYYAINDHTLSQITTSMLERNFLAVMLFNTLLLTAMIGYLLYDFLSLHIKRAIMRRYGELTMGKVVDVEIKTDNKYQREINLTVEFISPKTSKTIQDTKYYNDYPLSVSLPTIGRIVYIFHTHDKFWHVL